MNPGFWDRMWQSVREMKSWSDVADLLNHATKWSVTVLGSVTIFVVVAIAIVFALFLVVGIACVVLQAIQRESQKDKAKSDLLAASQRALGYMESEGARNGYGRNGDTETVKALRAAIDIAAKSQTL